MKLFTLLKACALALLFIFANSFLSAQSPVINATNSNPVIGESFTLELLDSASLSTFTNSPSGANQSWNFTTLSSSVSETIDVVSVASTPYAADFPTSTICLYYNSQQAFDYYVANNGEFARSGAVTGGQAIPYDDPAQFRQYPMSLGDSYTDSLHADYFSGVQFERVGIVTVEADAYGTITLPYGTFSDVLRLKVIEDYEDRSSFNISTYDAVTYQYMLPGQHLPLLSHSAFTFLGQTSSSGSMLSAQSVSALEAFMDQSSFFLYPNPASDQASVHYVLENPAPVFLRLVSMNGQEVYRRDLGKQQPGEYDFGLDVSDYAKGLYILDLRVNGIRTTRKLQVR